MTTLGGIWDGGRHLLTPGEHFPEDGAYLVIDKFEEQEEEDILSPFESPSVDPVLRDTQYLPATMRLPMQEVGQAWGALSSALSAFANIANVRKDQFQENNHATGETLWSFQTKQELGERI